MHMPREGRDVDVGSELEVSRLDAPGRSEPPALDRAPRPGEAEDPDALHRAFGDIGERTGASGSRSDAGSLSSASSSLAPLYPPADLGVTVCCQPLLHKK